MDLSDLKLFALDDAFPKAQEHSEYLETVFAGKRVKVLDEPTKRALVRQAQAGDIAARNKLVEHDMPLIVQVSRRYLDKGLPFEDIVQAGTLGMITAIGRFDLEMGIKLNTYTVPYILKAMREAMYYESRAIRLPKDKYTLLYNARKARFSFEEKYGRHPTMAELAAILDYAPAAIEEVLRLENAPLSLNTIGATDGEGGVVTLAELLEDESWVSGEDRRQAEDVRGLLPQYIARLRPNYRLYLTRRFGLDGEPEMLQAHIAQLLGVTRARAGQIQALAMTALREMIEQDGLTLSDLL